MLMISFCYFGSQFLSREVITAEQQFIGRQNIKLHIIIFIVQLPHTYYKYIIYLVVDSVILSRWLSKMISFS